MNQTEEAFSEFLDIIYEKIDEVIGKLNTVHAENIKFLVEKYELCIEKLHGYKSQIVEIQVEEISKRIKEKNLKLIISEKAKEFIADSSFDTHYGARPIKRFIQTNLLNKLAKIMLEDRKENKSDNESIVEVDLLEEKDKDTKEIKKDLLTLIDRLE